ncbi:MAG: ribonuclease HII [Candidatus Paceibacterota bacterium]
MIKKSKSYTIGIDEVGRGPIAGPVAVCSLCLGPKFKKSNFQNFRDSKKLSHLQRLNWLEKINIEKEKGNIFYKVCLESNEVIDQRGLTFAIKRALSNSLNSLKIKPKNCEVLLDGGLRAPIEYINQKTIIKGDEKELAIALASIVAKVTRDALMVKLAKKYPGYGLEKHKGYGTSAHYKALKNKGLSPIHRKSFLKKLDF